MHAPQGNIPGDSGRVVSRPTVHFFLLMSADVLALIDFPLDSRQRCKTRPCTPYPCAPTRDFAFVCFFHLLFSGDAGFEMRET
jgi:hypothetical protein